MIISELFVILYLGQQTYDFNSLFFYKKILKVHSALYIFFHEYVAFAKTKNKNSCLFLIFQKISLFALQSYLVAI